MAAEITLYSGPRSWRIHMVPPMPRWVPKLADLGETSIQHNHHQHMSKLSPAGCKRTRSRTDLGLNSTTQPQKLAQEISVSKFVGETEKDVRDLFADDEQDQRTIGDQSDLHVIIFDEIDAICKSRGTTRDGTGVHDSIVNQLLTKIDGVESLNNVLLIGMTNRKDLLDEALMR
ncbi:hypothetical protein FXO37_12867 [Capsicum annuum]|nr:hypothetical protein FXO37_12867 [Capsicum annuum]